MRYIVMLFLTLNLVHAETIKIAVAANVSYAMQDLKQEFQKLYPNTKLQVTIGGSGKLTAQIINGAPYELFLSANMKYPNALFKNKTAISKPVLYAKGSLVLLSSTKQDFSKGLNILKIVDIKKIAVANPKTAPYGQATMEALKNAKIYNEIKNKFVYSESISGTIFYTQKVADIGFIAKSSLYSPHMKNYKKGINWVEVDASLYAPIKQGIVILKKGQNKKGVKAFYDFILGLKAKKIFKKYGYILDE